MRRIGLLALVFLFACGDPGPRDRSLLKARRKPGPNRLNPYQKPRGHASVIGLVPDPLAHYYDERAELVIRFHSLAALTNRVRPTLRAVRMELPSCRLPTANPERLLRDLTGLAESIRIDAVRPFALVRTKGKWSALLPARIGQRGGKQAKQIDARYCIAGPASVVAAYEPGFRKGFYLPGDISVTTRPESIPLLLAEIVELMPDFAALLPPGWSPPIPPDIDRIDIAGRWHDGEVRLDIRAAPHRESETALQIARLHPAGSDIVRWLPNGGVFYLESSSPPSDLEALGQILLGKGVRRGEESARVLFVLRRLLEALGRDVAIHYDVEPTGAGNLLLLAHLPDPAETRGFLGSYDLIALLRMIAGDEGLLEWKPKALQHEGIPVASITGYISRQRILEWQRRDDLLLTTLSRVLRGPVVAHVAVVDKTLCVALGRKARRHIQHLIDHRRKGQPSDNKHSVAADALFPTRLAAFSGDLDELFFALREAAPYWHPRGRSLRDLDLPDPLPVTAALTAEGGALRFAVRFPPRELAATIARIDAALHGRDRDTDD